MNKYRLIRNYGHGHSSHGDYNAYLINFILNERKYRGFITKARFGSAFGRILVSINESSLYGSDAINFIVPGSDVIICTDDLTVDFNDTDDIMMYVLEYDPFTNRWLST